MVREIAIMKATIIKGYLSILMLVALFLPGAFYLVYVSTNSIWLSLLSMFFSYFLWRYIFGGELRKRQVFADKFLANEFPASDEDPFLNAENSFSDKTWVSGSGYTNDMDQPMYVKASERGIALLFICRGEKKPVLIGWDRLSQLTFSYEATEGADQQLARLFIPGIGMKIIVPWHQRFNQYIPEGIVLENRTVNMTE